VLQLWFWLTPIVYAIGILPGHFALILRLNPMYAICSSYQQVLLWGNPPHFKTLGAIVVLSLLLLAGGMFLFRRASPDMVDVL
jgi:lipopolysaccharide transport system permease protein